MEGCEHKWTWAGQQARRFLRRYRDAATRELLDDLTQEAVVLAWLWSRKATDPSRLGAAVLTIARRKRCRAVRERVRGRDLFVGDERAAWAVAAPSEGEDGSLSVDGRSVPLDWALQRLPAAMAPLSVLDRQLLLGFHEGFCCAELAQRFGRSEGCVKTRIHRARRRVREEFEAIVRAAGDLEGFCETKE
ncbi:MAG: hypothetical protein H6835_14235 [Planctomycetes bacterium]|nr:hypothetical protein [Planctomycetota bacterium]